MPDSERWRKWVPRLAVESVVVVFSILLALVVNEWRQEAEREARRERATEAIRSELLHNYREVRAVHPYHSRLADTLLTLVNQGVESVDPSVRPRGWIRTVDLVSAAWEAARSTGTTAQFRYPMLISVARAYEEQAAFRRRSDDLIGSVLQMAVQAGTPSLLRNPGGMAAVLGSLSDWEAKLLRSYREALTSIGTPRDSLSEDP